jgi:trimeric autotransporter adhesin
MKKLLLFSSIILLLHISGIAQNIGIGTTTPHASAVLDVKGTSKGFLLPRMTGPERAAIANPVEGLMVYDSTARGFYSYKRLMGGWTKMDFELPYVGYDNSSTSFSITNSVLPGSNPISILGKQGNYTGYYIAPVAVYGGTDIETGVAVVGDAKGTFGIGVLGKGTMNGIYGSSTNGRGIEGKSTNNTAVYGLSENGAGVIGQSNGASGTGVVGHGINTGVAGTSLAGYGVVGQSTTGTGLFGSSEDGTAVYAVSSNWTAIYGLSNGSGTYAMGVEGVGDGAGVSGITNVATGFGVKGVNNSTSGKAFGIKGTSVSGTDTTAGVLGETSITGSRNYNAYGVMGKATNGGAGVVGFGRNGGYGVAGYTDQSIAIFGSSLIHTAVWGTTYGIGSEGVRGDAWADNTKGVYGSTNGYANTRAVYGECYGENSIALAGTAFGSAKYALSATNLSRTVAHLYGNSSGDYEQLLIEEQGNDFTRIKFKNTTNAPLWTMGAYSSATGASAAARFNIYYNNLNNGTGGDAFSLDGNGNLTITGNAFKPGGGSWNIPSDVRLKKDITDFNDGLAVIRKIHPVNFRYNGLMDLPATKNYVGVLAQELQQAAPYMVEKINDSKEDYLQVDPNAMTYLLINAVKELDQQNRELRKELEELKQLIRKK